MGHTLIIAVIFFLSVSSMGFFCAALGNRRYEECLPGSIFGIIFILYLSGLFQALQVGVFLVLGLSAALYLISLALAVARKRVVSLLKNFFTPCFALFFGLFLFLIYCNEGFLFYHTDDFSHWGDILRVMTDTHGFGVSASARSYFGTYPPAISLIQYFFISLEGLLFPGRPLAEHLVYLAYQVTAVSLFLPFLHRLGGKSFLYLLLFFLGCFIVPLTLHENFFVSLYADPMVGLLAGFCFIYPYVREEGPVGRITFLLALFALTLSKGVGICFSLMAGMAFLASEWMAQRGKGPLKVRIEMLSQPIAAFAVILLAYGSWQILLWSHQPLFSDPWAGGGGIGAFPKTVVGTFADRLFVVQYFLGGHQQIGVCFLFLFALLMILASFVMGRILSLSPGTRKALLSVSAATVLVYMAGLCYAYMFQFSPDEAEYLYSFSRYAAVPLTMMLMMIFGTLCLWLEQAKLTGNTLMALLALFVMLFPYDSFRCLFKHEKVIESQAVRAPYDETAARVRSAIPEQEAAIYLISQEQEQQMARDDFWILRSLLRPLVIDNHNFYISPDGVLAADGISDITKFTKEQDQPAKMSAQDWQALLVSRYDYVLLFRLNDAFSADYASVFLEPETIREASLYRVQDDGGLEYVPMEP